MKNGLKLFLRIYKNMFRIFNHNFRLLPALLKERFYFHIQNTMLVLLPMVLQHIQMDMHDPLKHHKQVLESRRSFCFCSTVLIDCISSGDLIDLKLVHAVESVVIEWSHQIREVLKKDSAQPILDGLDPLPATELEFWKSKRAHLESISEQVKSSLHHSLSHLRSFSLASRSTCNQNG